MIKVVKTNNFKFLTCWQASKIQNSISRGFTMIEILVVVAIIGLITTVLFMTMKPLQQMAKAQDTQRKTDLNIISKALEDYVNDHPCYPEESPISDCGGSGFRPYLQKIPCDPQTKEPYEYERIDCNKFALYANLVTQNLTINYNQRGNYVVTSSNIVISPSQGGISREEAPTQIPPTQSPSLPPQETPTPIAANYYACISGKCVSIGRDPYCAPNYLSSNCYGQCGSVANPLNECKTR